MVRRAYANGDIYLGTYEGWYCPNEGFKAPSDLIETRDRRALPQPPRRDAPVAHGAQLVLPPVGLPGAAAARTTRRTRTGSSRSTAATRCWASSARASRTSRSAARGVDWGIPFPIAENGETAQRADGSWDPEAGVIYVWFDALINYITGAGFPDDPDVVRQVVAGGPARHRQGHQPLPHHLLAGDADERRASSRRARSGSTASARAGRADEQEPGQLPRPGRCGRRVRRGRRALRRPCARSPFDQDTEVSWDSLRAPLQRRPRQRLRQPRQPHRDDDQPLPRWRAAGARAAGESRSPGAGPRRSRAYGEHIEALPAPRGARRRCGEFVRRRPTGTWTRSSRGRSPRRRRRAMRPPRRSCATCWATSWRRAGSSGSPSRRSCPTRRRAILAQLGHDYPYGADGNGGPDVRDLLAWRAAAGPGRVTATPEPLFPRVESEAVETSPA